MSKLQMIKQLEYLAAFQAQCLLSKDWDSFDEAEKKIGELEERILGLSSENFSSQ